MIKDKTGTRVETVHWGTVRVQAKRDPETGRCHLHPCPDTMTSEIRPDGTILPPHLVPTDLVNPGEYDLVLESLPKPMWPYLAENGDAVCVGDSVYLERDRSRTGRVTRLLPILKNSEKDYPSVEVQLDNAKGTEQFCTRSLIKM